MSHTAEQWRASAMYYQGLANRYYSANNDYEYRYYSGKASRCLQRAAEVERRGA